jgi:hypothetical protein
MEDSLESNRSPFNRGPDPRRREMSGFCDTCGRVLEPMDYLSCQQCYVEKKRIKRRYSRRAAQRQLERALARVQELADDPMLRHWIPDAVILFGSMLKDDDSAVGDVDLCILGESTARRRLESFDQLREWARNNAPASFDYARLPFYPETAARQFIRHRNNLLAMTLQTDFTIVGGGRPFPYRIIWTRAGVDAAELQRVIEARRPFAYAESVREREMLVQMAEQRTLESSRVRG